MLACRCHKAKNSGTGNKEGTKVAHEVQEIQKAMPRARVVYCSATGKLLPACTCTLVHARLGSSAVCVDFCMTADCTRCCARLLQPAAAGTHLLPAPQDGAVWCCPWSDCLLYDCALLRGLCCFSGTRVLRCGVMLLQGSARLATWPT